jgi:bifunctional non-homologous end joining protein LigD
MAALRTYRAKRDFEKTPEPRGKVRATRGSRYVIQKHAARRLHYDLRLELDGAMMSWAVTRGPSLVPGDKRLAIHVEDHPIEYNTFEGTIPKGEYGGGTVMIWDRGTWRPEGDPHKGMKKGHLDFELQGKKLKGRWHLVRMKKRPGERQEPWLLIKSDDEFARRPSDLDILEEEPDSVASGRSIDEIAGAKKKRVWHSNKPSAQTQPVVRRPTVRANKRKKRAPRTIRKLRAKSDGHSKRQANSANPPDFIPPCLAKLSSIPPAGRNWLHEIKFDGYRVQARIAAGKVALKTRTGLDWTRKFPEIAKACLTLADHNAILDGEIVSVDQNGASDFSALQADLKSGRQDRLVYFVFDLLYLDGHDLAAQPLTDRKQLLARLIAGLPKDGLIRLSEHFETDGALMLKHACKLNLEGLVSKRGDAPYRSGRGGEWLKTKCTGSQEFVVAGWEPSDKKSRTIRSLLLAYHENGALHYAGRVGTGWGAKEERDLSRRLAPLVRKTSPFETVPGVERRRNVIWTEPRLVVEIDFRGWTGDKLVRQGAFKGVREDKPPGEIVRETSVMPSRSGSHTSKTKQAALQNRPVRKTATVHNRQKRKKEPVSVAGVALTHPDRVYWQDAGITKTMLAEYYAEIWDWIRPHVTGRVLALVRCPQGAGSHCFFQKHASAGIDTEHLHLVREPDGDKSIAIDSCSGLVALAQAGVLEIHRRGSTVDRLEDANHLVFDLDPGPGVQWADVVAAARDVRRRLHDRGLDSFPMSTGGNGLHVLAPIRFAPWDEVKEFCRRIAQEMSADNPGRYTATVRKAARRNRIFVDYLRNSREATAIAPYSTRARPGATVAVPVGWTELSDSKADTTFDIPGVRKRLARLRRDPWKGLAAARRRLPAS